MKKVKAQDVDRELLGEQSKALLHELHLLTPSGDLNADARRKLKQVNHFAGFVRPAIEELRQRHPRLQLMDVAAGNSYLGFILYELFLKNDASGDIVSIESRSDLVERGRERAKRLGFERMHFSCGAILEVEFPPRVHLITALHACDTATDDAIVRAIREKIDFVFLVPCCQAEVANLLKKSKTPMPVAALFSENLHRREFGAHLTNVIRALALKAHGYQVTVTELTSWEHTAKGELIFGKRVQAFDHAARDELMALLKTFDIHPQIVSQLYG